MPVRRNLVVVALLVLALVGAGWLLRAGASPADSAASSGAMTSPGIGATDPSAAPSGNNSPAAAAATATTVAFVGDSFAAGVGATSPTQRWTSLVAVKHGWTEKNYGHPQSGYAAMGTVGPCAATVDACPNYATQVPAIVAAAPELVILSGGGNDAGVDPAVVKSSIDQTLSGLRAGLPNAKIVVVNPWWDMRPQPESLSVLTEALKASAATAGVVWADTGQPIAGKGTLLTSDGLQANDAGHAALAATVDAALKLANVTS